MLVLTATITLLGCDGPVPPRPKDDPVENDPVVPADPEPERAPVVESLTTTGWGAMVEDCGGPCSPAKLRAQSSSEATVAGETKDGEPGPQRILLADFAVDGDAATAWCATAGVGQRLSLALPEPWDVRRLHLGLANVDPTSAEGPFESWTEAKLTTDRKDHLTIALPALDAPGATPPVLDVELAEVQFLQLEVLELSGAHAACVREVIVEGSPR